MQFFSLNRPAGRPLTPARRSRRLAPVLLLALPLLVGVNHAAATPSVTPTTLHTAKGDLVTGDAATFGQKLKQLGRGGQVIVWLKETSTPRPTPEFLVNLQGSAPESIALATEAPGVQRRNTLGPASVRRASADAVVQALSKAGALDLVRMNALPALTLRLPEHTRTAALQLLLRHPNVDYVSGVRASAATPHASPIGANPIDYKHTFHKIPQVWDLTRGSGVKVGVLDSGFARSNATGAFHDDGQNLGSHGIVPLGFVDDGCNSTSTANNGGCTPYDDQWTPDGNFAHGTAAAGIVGQNDNNHGYVGIAPLATTYSMKIAWNTYVHGHCNENPFHDYFYCIETDDFARAVDYAAAGRFHVLSMSLASDYSSDIYRALATARNSYGVLPMAATGNEQADGPQEPASWDVVMGVAGVDAAGNNVYSTHARDVSGLTYVDTLAATCYQYYYCDAGSPGRLGGLGGTSAATAVVAGLAALVRSYHPNETPDQISERLTNTAEGPNRVVNAYAAITNHLPVNISGSSYVPRYSYETWYALTSGGTGPYTYTWYRDGVQVATGDTYSDYAMTDFELRATVKDSAGRTGTKAFWVTVYEYNECGASVASPQAAMDASGTLC